MLFTGLPDTGKNPVNFFPVNYRLKTMTQKKIKKLIFTVDSPTWCGITWGV